MNQLVSRMIRAAKLDSTLYEEVEKEPSAISQAAAVIVIAGLAAGIGSVSRIGAAGILLGTAGALISWAIWAYIIYLIGAKLFPEAETQSGHMEMLRTVGFAVAPGTVRVLALIPGLFGFVFFVSNIWMIASMIVAVRQALDYKSTWRAAGVCVLGWVSMFILTAFIGAALRGAAF